MNPFERKLRAIEGNRARTLNMMDSMKAASEDMAKEQSATPPPQPSEQVGATPNTTPGESLSDRIGIMAEEQLASNEDGIYCKACGCELHSDMTGHKDECLYKAVMEDLPALIALEAERDQLKQQLDDARKALVMVRPIGCDWPNHVQSEPCHVVSPNDKSCWCVSCKKIATIDAAIKGGRV